MSGPTTAAELLHLAEQQVHQLTALVGTERAASPAQLAAAWPLFHRAGRQLIAVLHPDVYGDATPGRQDRAPAEDAAGATAMPPVPQLARAAELISVAADLIVSYDRRGLRADDHKADLARATRPLIAGAHLLAQATLPDITLLDCAASALSAAQDWSRMQPTGFIDPRAGSFHDGGTRPSQTPVTGSAGSTALLNTAIARWQHAALRATHRAAPSSQDLQGISYAAGGLVALSQVLLRAHEDPAVTEPTAVARTISHLQTAGRGWNSAATSWGSLATGTPPDLALQTATAHLDQAASLLARTDGRWAPPEEVATRAGREPALRTARGALIAVQSVADTIGPAVSELARTGGLYAPARRMQASVDNLEARLKGRWLPTTSTEHGPLLVAYQQLPTSTATARLSYTALTSPALHSSPPRPDQPRQPPGQTPAEALPDVGALTVAGRRWQHTASELDRRLLTDPHWYALAGALDRVELAGVDVPSTLRAAAAEGPLPEQHPARALHYRLIEVCDAALTPNTTPTMLTRPPSRTAATPTAATSRPLPQSPGRRR